MIHQYGDPVQVYLKLTSNLESRAEGSSTDIDIFNSGPQSALHFILYIKMLLKCRGGAPGGRGIVPLHFFKYPESAPFHG